MARSQHRTPLLAPSSTLAGLAAVSQVLELERDRMHRELRRLQGPSYRDAEGSAWRGHKEQQRVCLHRSFRSAHDLGGGAAVKDVR